MSGALDPERIVRLEEDAVVILDQRRLPELEVELRLTTSDEVAEAIKTLAVRGAPAIGVAAAYGLALAAEQGENLDDAYATLASSRPTAVNLVWALRADAPRPFARACEGAASRGGRAVPDDVAPTRSSCSPRTHACSPTATPAASRRVGTAPRSGRSARPGREGASARCGSTRPDRSCRAPGSPPGSSSSSGIDHAVIVDGAAASLMAAGEVDLVVTGADRIAANGDTANKIGTYGLAVLAHHHGLPLVVVAPTSTLDPATPTGKEIPVEERDGAEITTRFAARNPAFDVTPAALVSAIVTERGVHRAPYDVHRRMSEPHGVRARDRGDPGTVRVRSRAVREAAVGRRRQAGSRGPRTSWRVRSSRRCPRTCSSVPERRAPAHEARRTRPAWRRFVTGRIAQVVLAGGMATRFGGVVKAVVEVIDGRSFLDLSLGETARLAAALDAEIPVAVMTSFATDTVVRAHAAELAVPMPLVFSQSVSLRLEPDGELFEEDDGRVSLYAPGHGDLFDALRGSGTLAALEGTGVEHLAIANVDNLGARLDPVVIGSHLLAGNPFTVEVAAKDGDTGGAPARVAGAVRLVEGPCFPPDVRSGLDSGVQHELGARRARCHPGTDRADVALRREARRRSPCGTARAALPRALGTRGDDVSRGAAARSEGSLHAGQAPGGSRSGPARAPRDPGPTASL